MAPLSRGAQRPAGLSDDDPTILVFPRISVAGLNQISMVDQTFETELQLELTWHDPALAQRLAGGEKWDGEMRGTLWHPGLMMENLAELKKDPEVWYRLVDEKAGLLSFNVRLRAVFRERFELKRFPFDCQWLTVRFSSCWTNVRFTGSWPEAGRKLHPQQPADDFVNLSGFILEEWKCYPAVCLQGRPTSAQASSSGCVYHSLNAKLMIQRESGYCKKAKELDSRLGHPPSPPAPSDRSAPPYPRPVWWQTCGTSQ